ncbi:MAG: DUF4349 domain-containing protein [Planctomycetes bacterium]|nr:DUF4349 domain-containing protein [Planctomycetota bacterium]
MMRNLLPCLLAFGVLSGCASYPSESVAERDVETRYDDSFVANDSSGGPAQVPQQANAGLATEARLERADLRIERAGWIRVDSGEEMQASKKLRRMAAQFDATVMSFNDHAVSFKMPSARLELLLEAIEKTEGWEIDEFDFSAWDRTGEYFSVEARIASTTAVKERMLKLLESAATLEEVLKISNKLEDIQQQLDGFQGAMRDIGLKAGRVEVAIIFN